MHSKARHLRSDIGDQIFLTDGGMETVMVFHEGIDLPQFASFTLLDSAEGRAALTKYYTAFLDEAATQRAGFVLDTATWRASSGWGQVMGLEPARIDAINREAVALVQGLRAERPRQAILINGVIGPHGDAYAPDHVLSAETAQEYHRRQVNVLAAAGVDLISAVTISSLGEAIGIAKAATEVDQPVTLSFTVETDGRLISGMSLADAIHRTDDATDAAPLWYGINCAHPDHFRDILRGDWVNRIGSVRANASRRSHAELDESTELDDGDIAELAQDYHQLLHMLPGLHVLGGCCGTDLRHVAAIGRSCLHHQH
ncbi:MAG: homocysteine S-methyltransferase family protein [Pseudomonadota bacterium]